MAKNIFATFGILAVLLMSLGMVSAAGVDDFELSIVGGDLVEKAGENIVFTVNLTSSFTEEIYVNWAAPSNAILIDGVEGDNYSVGSNNVSGFGFVMPESGSWKELTAHVYNASNLTEYFGNETVRVYFKILGCTDSSANNYDSNATKDDGSCTYDTACRFEHNVSENGDLEISDFDISNNGKGDEDAWEYMDTIEIEVEIENTDNDEDVDDVEVQVIVLDDAGNDVTRDFEFDEDVITSIGRLKDDDQETVLFTIEEVPADVEAGDYFLYIVAYSDGEESEQCISEYDGDLYFEFSVEFVDYEDAIVVKESELGFSVDTYCGEKNLEITIPVYNLYDEDEERVLVNIYNSELGINEFQVIDDLNDGDNEDVSFFVSIPESLSKEKYDLDIYLHFDWDDDEDEYDEFAYEELNDKTSLRLNILGCKGPAPSMVPSLGSVVQEGTELIVKTLVTNNGEDNDFAISVSGYESWAELVSVTPETVNIKEGEFIEVSVILMPITSGMKSFKISATVGDDVFNQPVSVNVKEAPSAFGFSGLPLYLTAGIGGMLLLILLVLVVKISRRKPVKAQF